MAKSRKDQSQLLQSLPTSLTFPFFIQAPCEALLGEAGKKHLQWETRSLDTGTGVVTGAFLFFLWLQLW